MADLKPNYAPYAYASNVVPLIRRLHDRGWPDPFTASEIVRLGFPEGSSTRTFQALRFLRLVTEDGTSTETRETLRRASKAEYPNVLATILQEVYHRVFEIYPADATEDELLDAFRCYEPHGQRPHMVNLFVDLCTEAHLREGWPIEYVARKRTGNESPKRTGTETPKKQPPAGGPQDQNQTLQREQETPPPPPPPPNDVPPVPTGRYAILEILIQQLPASGKWPADRLKDWKAMFDSALTFHVKLEGGADSE